MNRENFLFKKLKTILLLITNNKERLTGHHETAHWSKFSWGVADRGASIRIPRETEANCCGYFEDRRPASNMDPYKVTSLLLSTVLS